MKKLIRKAVILFCGVSLLCSFGACGATEASKETKEANAEVNTENMDNKESGNEAVGELVVEKENAKQIYDYCLSHELSFNGPKGYYWNYNRSRHQHRIIVENSKDENGEYYFECEDDWICVEEARETDVALFSKYLNEKIWKDGKEDSSIIDEMEVDTPCGKVTVLVEGYEEEEYITEHCLLLDNAGGNWYITRHKVNTRPIEDILLEMFTGRTEETKEKEVIENVNVEIVKGEYAYTLQDEQGREDTIVDVFGFNEPTGYKFDSNDISALTTGERIYKYEFRDFSEGVIFNVRLPHDNISYIKRFLDTGEYTEGYGNEYRETLISLEEKDVLQTKYGTARVIYQISYFESEYDEYLTFKGKIAREMVLLKVNDYEVLITFKYNNGMGISNPEVDVAPEYAGILKEQLPNMFGE